ncbi:MAG: 3D-(3,5/4)-trihydroxycyclohexane-1,2-dione acylhydrolase (decyclizing) [Acidimicrobiia bacterium]
MEGTVETARLTTAQAIVRYLLAQKIEDLDNALPLFAGVFAIFGHGNVTCLGEALEQVQDRLPTWRGQNEQSMTMAAVAFAKARVRRQVMVATSSIGPGAANMVTTAGIAMADRLPLLILSGDTFAHRLADPVLQQVEHFGDPTRTVNDAFKPVVRYWDRITHPAQILSSLPQAIAVMLDPAECGPAFIGLAQDVQAEAFDYPVEFFSPRIWRLRRPGPDPSDIALAAAVLSTAERPVVVAGGGVHYAQAEATVQRLAERHNLPVVETVAGKTCLVWDHPNFVGPIGVTGSSSANAVAADADVVLAVGTRLQDFTTGSWSVFQNKQMRLVAINTARFDAMKHQATPMIGDAKRGLQELSAALADWQAPPAWLKAAQRLYEEWNRYLDKQASPVASGERPSYQAVIRTVWENALPTDYIVSAAGGLPGELNKGWRSLAPRTFDCEYGFSCMGYEIGGAWGAAMAHPDRQVISFCGDGSYLMANSEIYSSVLTGHKFILVLCDNSGYAVIDRLQTAKGGASFNNLFENVRRNNSAVVDFSSHARSLGANAEEVGTLAELGSALTRARSRDRTTVLVIKTDPGTWTGGDAWWEVGVPEVSEQTSVRLARAEHEAERKRQRIGI